MCQNLNVDIVTWLNWLWQLKPVTDWESSLLTFLRNGVNYKIYPKSYIIEWKASFFFLVEKESSTKLNLDTFNLEGLYFYKTNKSSKGDISIVKELYNVFQESLPGLPPCREIEHEIKIIGTLPKPSSIYKLSPLEDETLKTHLSEAMERTLSGFPSLFLERLYFLY